MGVEILTSVEEVNNQPAGLTEIQGRFLPDWFDPVYREHVKKGIQNSGKSSDLIEKPDLLVSQCRDLNLLVHLTPDQLRIIEHRYVYHRSQLEIAAQTNKTPKTVSKIERNGLGRLNRYFQRRQLIDEAEKRGILDELAPSWREVLEHRYVAGKSTRQTAIETFRHPHVISSMEFKALKRINTKLRCTLKVEVLIDEKAADV